MRASCLSLVLTPGTARLQVLGYRDPGRLPVLFILRDARDCRFSRYTQAIATSQHLEFRSSVNIIKLPIHDPDTVNDLT